MPPVKDDKALYEFEEGLKKAGEKYYVLFEIGLGTGLKLPDILDFRNGDVQGKESIELNIGKKNTRRVFKIPEKLQREILCYTEGKDPEAWLFPGRSGSGKHLSKERVTRVMKKVGEDVGLPSVGGSTMRKTFAWNYYKATNDIYYLQNLLNHASPSITYRYIGEKPNVEVYLKKMTPEENERSRYMLYKNGNGKKRIEAIREMLSAIDAEMDNPLNNDAYYGRVDCLLTEMEDLVENFNKTK